MQIFFVLLFFSLTPFTDTKAEYRVYQYYIKNKTENLNNSPATIVTSTLNPKSFLAYHGGPLMIEVNLIRSWQCMGDTSKKPICELGTGKELNNSSGAIQ